MTSSLDNVWGDFEKSLYEIKTTNTQTKKDEYNCECVFLNNEPNITVINNVLLCENCGIVFEDRIISDEAEWRTFNNDEGRGFNDYGNRCGMVSNPLAPNHSMSTVISGNSNMAKRQFWLSLPYEEKVLFDLKKKLNSIFILNNIPNNYINSTLLAYKKFKDNNIDSCNNKKSFRKKNKDAVIAVCFYYVAKSSSINISSEQVCKIFELDNKTFSKYCKIYNESISNVCDNDIFSAVELADRYIINLELSFNIQKLCKKIISACVDLELFYNTCPQGIIAGVIYFINLEMNLSRTKKEISKVCDIGENTILRIYKVICENKIEIFNKVKKIK